MTVVLIAHTMENGNTAARNRDAAPEEVGVDCGSHDGSSPVDEIKGEGSKLFAWVSGTSELSRVGAFPWHVGEQQPNLCSDFKG